MVASKKKDKLWDLITRLDEEAAQYNETLQHANIYFDKAASKTKSLLEKHEADLHSTISKLKKAIKIFTKENKKK